MKSVKKVPIVIQMENLECGAASLCMILAYYGKWVPLERARIDCGVSRDGSNAKNIILAARGYGLKASGYRKEPKSLREISLPAIIHWNFNHFVVLNGFNKKGAVINDPARGTVTVTNEEFDRSFTGIVLCFEPTEDFIQDGKPKRMWPYMKDRLTGEMRAFALIVGTGIILSSLALLVPLFSKIYLDYILSGGHPEWLGPLIIAMIFIMCFSFVVNVVQSRFLLKLQGKLAISSGAKFFWHVLHLPMQFFGQRHMGDIVARQTKNEGIAYVMINQLAPVMINIMMLMVYIVIMGSFNIKLTLVVVGAAAINLYVMRYVDKKRAVLSQGLMRDAGKLSGVTMSGFEMMETIKASGAENGFFERWAGYFAKNMNTHTDFQKTNRILGVLPSLLQQLTSIVILMMGVYLILEGNFSIGMLLAFQGFLTTFLTPINTLSKAGQAFTEMKASMLRIEDVLKYPADMAYEASYDLSDKNEVKTRSDIPLKGGVELSNISFGYSKLAPPLIEGFDLSLKPGQSVAFVGGSGSGKSTLAKIIAGLYQPWTGSIAFDGRASEEIAHHVKTDGIAVVDQNIILFEDRIIDNLTLWDSTVDEADLVNACKDAQIHEDVMNRSDGYQHWVREGGKNFSGGQCQRFEIARALVGNPSILIMDEATSALDTKTEALIMEAVKRRKLTLIIVAHRLSTIRDCDEIIVLSKGKVIERGKHEILMQNEGHYAKLVEN